MLPEPHEAAQLLRLRALRVRRAEQRYAATGAEVARALAAVRARQATIERLRTSAAALGRAIVDKLAPHLPRWSAVVRAEREQLADRMEREESELVDDEQALETANEAMHVVRVELARARSREDLIRDIASQAKRARHNAHEQKNEQELEDRPVKAVA